MYMTKVLLMLDCGIKIINVFTMRPITQGHLKGMVRRNFLGGRRGVGAWGGGGRNLAVFKYRSMRIMTNTMSKRMVERPHSILRFLQNIFVLSNSSQGSSRALQRVYLSVASL